MTPDTEQLLERAAAGDKGAEEALLERHRAPLKRMVAVRIDRRIAGRVDGSDLVQEALTEAAARLSDYLARRPIAFYPWLRQIAERKLVDAYRHHHRDRRAVTREAPQVSLSDASALKLAQQLCPRPSPSQAAVHDETRHVVRAAIESLDPCDAEIVVLYHLEHLSLAEIADVLNISEEAAKSRRRRALLRLSKLLEPLRGES